MNRPRSVFDSVRSLVILALLLGAAAAATLGAQSDDGGRPGERRAAYAIGLWGDLPYSTEQANPGVPHLIADMNAQKLAFTAHDGDLKAGGGRCDDQIYLDSLAFFNALEAPAVFTPGDNDWVDCDRIAGVSLVPGAARLRAAPVLQHRILARPAPDSPRGADGAAVPRTSGPVAVRGESPLGYWRRHLRDAERSGFVQQPVRHGARSSGVRCTQRRQHRLAASDVRARGGAGIGGGDADHAGESGLGRFGSDARTASEPAHASANRRTARWLRGVPQRAPQRGDRVPQAGRLRARRLALLPRRQAVPGRVWAGGSRTSPASRRSATTRQNGTNDVHWLKVVVDVKSREVFSYEPQMVPANRVAVPQP